MAQLKFKPQLIVDRCEHRLVELDKERAELRFLIEAERAKRRAAAEEKLAEYRVIKEKRIAELHLREYRFFTGPLSLEEADRKFSRERPDIWEALQSPSNFIKGYEMGFDIWSSPEEHALDAKWSDDSRIKPILEAAKIAATYSPDSMELSHEEVNMLWPKEKL